MSPEDRIRKLEREVISLRAEIKIIHQSGLERSMTELDLQEILKDSINVSMGAVKNLFEMVKEIADHVGIDFQEESYLKLVKDQHEEKPPNGN